jgi:DNA-directed RNA polymerase specialized sigma24 family protein
MSAILQQRLIEPVPDSHDANDSSAIAYQPIRALRHFVRRNVASVFTVTALLQKGLQITFASTERRTSESSVARSQFSQYVFQILRHRFLEAHQSRNSSNGGFVLHGYLQVKRS